MNPNWPSPILGAVTITALATLTLATLRVDPPMTAAEIGSGAVFTCSDDNDTGKVTDFFWVYPTDASSRARAANGTLTLVNLTLSDAGEYECRAKARNNGTSGPKARLVVYAMPDYIRYMVVAASVAALLMAAFIAGQVCKERRERLRYKDPEKPAPKSSPEQEMEQVKDNK